MRLLPSTEQRKTLTVELTPQDLDVIWFAIHCCGGSPDGPRSHAYQIAQQLKDNGAAKLADHPRESNYFPDTWEYEV